MSYVSNSQKLSINSSGIIDTANVPQTSASSLITDLGSNNFRVNFSRRIIKQLSSSDFTLVGCTISSIVNNNQSALVTFSLTPTAQNYSVTLIADSLGEFGASNTVALTDAATVTLNSGTALAVDTVRFTATFNYPITQTLTSSIVSVSTGAVSNFSKAANNLSVTFDVTVATTSFTVQTNAVSGVIKQSNLVSKTASAYHYSAGTALIGLGAPASSVISSFKTIGNTCYITSAASYSNLNNYDSGGCLVDGVPYTAQNAGPGPNIDLNEIVCIISGPSIPAGVHNFTVYGGFDTVDLRIVSTGATYTSPISIRIATIGY